MTQNQNEMLAFCQKSPQNTRLLLASTSMQLTELVPKTKYLAKLDMFL